MVACDHAHIILCKVREAVTRRGYDFEIFRPCSAVHESRHDATALIAFKGRDTSSRRLLMAQPSTRARPRRGQRGFTLSPLVRLSLIRPLLPCGAVLGPGSRRAGAVVVPALWVRPQLYPALRFLVPKYCGKQVLLVFWNQVLPWLGSRQRSRPCAHRAGPLPVPPPRPPSRAHVHDVSTPAREGLHVFRIPSARIRHRVHCVSTERTKYSHRHCRTHM